MSELPDFEWQYVGFGVGFLAYPKHDRSTISMVSIPFVGFVGFYQEERVPEDLGLPRTSPAKRAEASHRSPRLDSSWTPEWAIWTDPRPQVFEEFGRAAEI